MPKKVWMYSPKPKKLNDAEKLHLKRKVQEFIQNSKKLSVTINRVEIRAGRIYLYHLVEQFGWDDPRSKFIFPLIDGKYAEFPYARVTSLQNGIYSLGWQKHNRQWIELFEDTLMGCLEYIVEDNAFFY